MDIFGRTWIAEFKPRHGSNFNDKGGDNSMTDYKTAREEAIAEVAEEETQKAKREYKMKLKELAGAEKVVTNIKRELEDLDDKYSQK